MFEVAKANAEVDALVDDWAQIATLHARAAQRAARIGDHYAGDDDWAREEISLALHVSGYVADQLLQAGRAMRGRFVQAGKAVCAGETSYLHLVKLIDETKDLDDDMARLVDAEVLDAAREEAPGKFASIVRKTILRLDPEGAETRRQQATRGRDVAFYGERDGQATFAQTGPADLLAPFYAEVDARAVKTGPDDERDIGARRFDAFLDIVENGVNGSTGPTRHGRRTQVNVTMTLATALGLADTPAELDGYGPITAQAARILARDAKWRAFIVDAATGALEGLGNEGYEPNQRTQDFIAARDRVCRIPHCNQPAWRCHDDHAIPYAQGGPTNNENLGAHDTRHHRLKHEAGWTVVQDPDGTRHWTTALGRTYEKRPPPYPVDDADPPPF